MYTRKRRNRALVLLAAAWTAGPCLVAAQALAEARLEIRPVRVEVASAETNAKTRASLGCDPCTRSVWTDQSGASVPLLSPDSPSVVLRGDDMRWARVDVRNLGSDESSCRLSVRLTPDAKVRVRELWASEGLLALVRYTTPSGDLDPIPPLLAGDDLLLGFEGSYAACKDRARSIGLKPRVRAIDRLPSTRRAAERDLVISELQGVALEPSKR